MDLRLTQSRTTWQVTSNCSVLFRVLHNAEGAAEVHTLPAATTALIWSAQDHHEDKDEDEDEVLVPNIRRTFTG